MFAPFAENPVIETDQYVFETKGNQVNDPENLEES